jgi:protein-tyrosine phosphatase
MNSKALSIESCGLDAEGGTPSPVEAIVAARRFGLELEKHLSKDFKNCEFENADLILAMEFWQYRKLIALFPAKKNNIGLLRGFAPFPENLLCNIDDPFGKSQDYFHKCFSQIERSVDRIKISS